MAIKTIPLSRLETDLEKTLNECAESGQTLVVELSDQRLLAIQSLDPNEDDSLMDELLASNPRFQALVAKSKATPANRFHPGARANQRFKLTEAAMSDLEALCEDAPGETPHAFAGSSQEFDKRDAAFPGSSSDGRP
jgi:hypothetical protein